MKGGSVSVTIMICTLGYYGQFLVHFISSCFLPFVLFVFKIHSDEVPFFLPIYNPVYLLCSAVQLLQ